MMSEEKKIEPKKKRGRPRKNSVTKVKSAKKEPVIKPETQIANAESSPEIKVETPAKKERYFYAIGRRKTAMAKVRGFENLKDFTVNTKELVKYFPTKPLQKIVLSPLATLGLESKLGWKVNVSGGGYHAQAEAVRHGIAKALVSRNAEDRRTLKKAGFLTRDPRVKERKKPGLKKARRAPQWSKR